MSKILNLFRNLSIRNRLLLVFSTIFVAAILLENLLLLAFVRQFATAAIKKQLKISTGYVMNMVKTSVDVSVRNHLRAVAENMHSMVGLVYAEYREGILSEEAAKSMVEGIIREQTIGRTGYIYLLNGRGTVVYHPEKALVGEDMSGLTFVQKQLNQKRGYTEYEWKNPGEAAEREKTVHWVYFQPWDWLISVSVYRDEFDAIFNVDDFKESILTMTLGKSGYPYVMDSQGNLIIHPVPQEANIYDRKDADGREIIKEICRLKTGSIVYPAVIPGRMEPRQVLEIFNYLPDLDWIVTATVYLDELYEPFLTLYFACLVTILLVLLLVFSMTWWISSSISNTFRDLMDNLSIGAMGDYSKRLSVR
ncbi:MAG: diguanylate cyclase, partial [Proteobacteria bacterium]|nr:diguanylate cyclase [Pseudomonadota bacterium]